MRLVPMLAAMAVGIACHGQEAFVVDAAAPPKIDGRLEPGEWRGAQTYTRLGRHTNNAEAFPQRTEFKFLRDADNLFVGIECEEPLAANLDSSPAERGWPKGDSVELFLDTVKDRKSYVQLAVGCNGSQYDSRDKRALKPLAWEAAAAVGDKGWTVELKIPFASLSRTAPATGDSWGFNLCRNRDVGGGWEAGTWANVGAAFHTPGKFGRLTFGGQEEAYAQRRRTLDASFAALRRQADKVPPEYGQALADFERLSQGRTPTETLERKLKELKDELLAIKTLNDFNSTKGVR